MRVASKLLSILFFLLIIHSANAQNTKAAVKTILTADSLSSGNLKDVLTSFFQLSYDKLTGPNKELNFSSNPYALLLKTNPAVAIDTNYHKYSFMRKLNFGFGLKLDTSYKFNGFSSVIKYALIDERDATTSKWLFDGLGSDSLNQEITSLQADLTNYITTTYPNTAESGATRLKYLKLINVLLTDTITAFNQLDTAFQSIVKKVAAESNLRFFSRLIQTNPKVNLRRESRKDFSSLKEELKKKLLWTVSLSDTTYKNEFFFSNIVFKTELLKGMVRKPRPGSNWELNIHATLNFTDDTTVKGRDLKRTVFHFEPGFNWVMRTKNSGLSFFEMKFSGQYNHIFNTLYTNEKRNFFTFNGTFRLRIFNEVWIPIEFKYNPKNGNLFGIINARFNFSLLNKMK